jgi:hypothetical protein
MNLTDSRSGLLGRGIGPSQSRYLHRTAERENKRGETSMLRVGFEITIPAFDRAKTFLALDGATTAIDEY